MFVSEVTQTNVILMIVMIVPLLSARTVIKIFALIISTLNITFITMNKIMILLKLNYVFEINLNLNKI
jgi:hypothetical protein